MIAGGKESHQTALDGGEGTVEQRDGVQSRFPGDVFEAPLSLESKGAGELGLRIRQDVDRKMMGPAENGAEICVLIDAKEYERGAQRDGCKGINRQAKRFIVERRDDTNAGGKLGTGAAEEVERHGSRIPGPKGRLDRELSLILS